MKLALCFTLLVLCRQPAWADDVGTAADCSVKKRHLHVETSEADSRGGRLSLRLDDFASLAGNESLSWKIVGDSISSASYQDRYGFRWSPPTGLSIKGSCDVQLFQNDGQLDITVECRDLHNQGSELPGYLNPPMQHFTCRLH